jgi:DNA-binding transcriptional regulator YiaG
MTPAELIKIRKATKLSQRALSELLFYSLTTIKLWEKGKHPIPSGMREYLIRAEIDVDGILKSTTNPEK